METHVTRLPAPGELRPLLLALLLDNPLVSPQEQRLATRCISQCEDVPKLLGWLLRAPLMLAWRQFASSSPTSSRPDNVV